MGRLRDTALLIFLAGLVMAPVSSPEWGNPWDDLRYPATVINIGFANPPSLVQFRDDGAGSPGTLVLEFGDQAVEGNEEQGWFDAQLPHGWREGSTVKPHVHWTLEDATSCNARFCLEYIVASPGGSWPANTSTSCADCASSATATDPQLCFLFASGLSMSGHTISAIISARIYRNSSHGNDTCDGKNALLHTSDIHVQISRPGSRLELTQ